MQDVEAFFQKHLPADAPRQRFLWTFISLSILCVVCIHRKDFLQYFPLLAEMGEPLWWVSRTAESRNSQLYKKGMHNLMGAQFNLLDHSRLAKPSNSLSSLPNKSRLEENENNRILAYQYLYTARINLYFLQGTFTKDFASFLFSKTCWRNTACTWIHRVLVFYYKIASLYFGSGNNEKPLITSTALSTRRWSAYRPAMLCPAAASYCSLWTWQLRPAGIPDQIGIPLHGQNGKPEPGGRSDVRFFLRRSFIVGAAALKPEFEKLLAELKQYEGNPLETRAFVYLDVISLARKQDQRCKCTGCDTAEVLLGGSERVVSRESLVFGLMRDFYSTTIIFGERICLVSFFLPLHVLVLGWLPMPGTIVILPDTCIIWPSSRLLFQMKYSLQILQGNIILGCIGRWKPGNDMSFPLYFIFHWYRICLPFCCKGNE